MPCDGDCFNCKYSDCIITDKELIRLMRKPRAKPVVRPQKHRIKQKVEKNDFKAEYILTPLPGSPEVQRTWEVKEYESKAKPDDKHERKAKKDVK